jgi:hypothetical protein
MINLNRRLKSCLPHTATNWFALNIRDLSSGNWTDIGGQRALQENLGAIAALAAVLSIRTNTAFSPMLLIETFNLFIFNIKHRNSTAMLFRWPEIT